MKKLFVPMRSWRRRCSSYAPFLILGAPYESDDGARPEDLLLPRARPRWRCSRRPSSCGVASAVFLFTRTARRGSRGGGGRRADVVFGLIVLVTGPLWARKAWGVWWQWDARLTSTLLLWLIFVAYLLLRRYGGPGSDEARRGRRALRHGERAVRLLVGELLADAPPEDERRADAAARHARAVLVLRRGVPAAVTCSRWPRASSSSSARRARRAVPGAED